MIKLSIFLLFFDRINQNSNKQHQLIVSQNFLPHSSHNSGI